ncbi:hypothetical protein [Nocardia farcinica]|uniref:hypothetical protein n=1 Tax=Nocardia farcinica TaxID=37329 RepID=UPI002458FA55|nr:hypothetical protein [Nocardia farcinica]
MGNPDFVPVTMRRGVMAWHCDHQFTTSASSPAAAVVRLPQDASRAHEFALPSLSGEKVEPGDSGTCATFGDGQDVRVTFAVASLKPSSGLEPEAHQLTLFNYRLGEDEPEATVTVWSGRERPVDISLHGTAAGVAVSFDLRGRKSPEIRAYQGTDLHDAWSMPGTVAASTNTTYLVTRAGNCALCPGELAVVTAADGALRYQPPPTGNPVGTTLATVTDSGYGFERPEGMLWFDEVTGTVPDAAPAALHNARGLLPDPMSTLIVVKYSVAGQPMFKVLDRTTWQEKLVIDAERTSGLRIDSVALYDGHLYVRNSSDSPVIRVSDSAVVSKGWQALPVGRIGNATVVAKAPSAVGSSNCVLDTLILDGTAHHPGEPNVYGLSTCPEFVVIPDIDGSFPGPRY